MKQTKVIWSKINKDSSIYDLEPGEYLDAVNLLPEKQNADVSGRRESMLGNTALSSAWKPAGTNTCVGAAWDKVNNVIVFVNQNSNGDHGIYEIDLTDNSISLIQSLSGLDNPLDEVDDISFLDDYVFWTDKTNVPSYLKKTTALSGKYVLSERSLFLSLSKPSPVTSPAFNLLTVEAIIQPNKIYRNGFYFAYRYVFVDNETSLLSPYSMMIQGNDQSRNEILLTINIASEIISFIKSVEVFVKRIGEASFRRFKVIESSSFASTVSYTGYDIEFDVPGVEESLLNYDVPRISNTLSVLKNVLIASYNSSGYGGFGSASLSPALGVEISNLQHRYKIWKPKSRRTIGIVYYDKYFKPSFVKNTIDIEFDDPIYTIHNNGISPTENRLRSLVLSSYNNKVTVAITGAPPSWARYYQLYMSDDLVFSDYTMCLANLLFYKKDGSSAGVNEIVIRDRIYQTVRPTYSGSSGTNQGFRAIDLQIPENLGFVVDTDCFVRIVTLTGDLSGFADEYFRVTDVLGEFIRIKKISKGNWTSQELVVGIEIVRFKENPTELFYAKSPVYATSAGAFTTTDVIIYADSAIKFWGNSTPSISEDGGAFYYPDANHAAMVTASSFEMTRYSTGQFITTALFDKPYNVSSEFYTFLTAVSDDDTPALIPDHSKEVEDKGWPNIINENEKEDNRSSTLSYSQPFIAESLVNQINQFLPSNKETLALNRGPIQKIVAVDEDVALIIHERTCTSAYIQEGFVKFVDGTDALTKTDEVIAQERKSRSNYGTINPESVAVLQNKVEGEAGTSNKVYWWDQNEGVVCRYSLNGVQPISDYGMKDYFSRKAEEMKAIADLKIVGGCHPFWKCYIISFPAYADTDAETWLFSEEQNGWIGRLPEGGERYCASGNQLFSFKNGTPYIHNNTVYGNFYGTQYDTSITFVVNEVSDLEKLWQWVLMQSNSDQIRLNITNEDGQSTFIDVGEYRLRAKNYYSDIRRDVNTNAALIESHQVARLHGDRMRSKSITVEAVFTGATKLQLDSFIFGYQYMRPNL
jgi:hypothetical protein